MKNKEPTRRSSRIPKNNEESSPIAGRKRKDAPSFLSSPKIQKKGDGGRKTDEYCWICHQLGQDICCNSCPRAYHSNCVKKKQLHFNTSGSCSECQAQFLSKGNNTPNIHKYSLTELLELAMQEALKDNGKKNNQKSQSAVSKFWTYFATLPENINLCQIIDLSFLIDKLKKKHYLTTAEFFSDIKWIYHNCYILHGVDSDITETALKLEKSFKQELLDLEACSECYYSKHLKEGPHSTFFAKICEEPHDIVWAKMRGSPFWPAKCMRIFNGHADVSFFGTHDRSSVQLSQCFRISQKSPNDKEIKQIKYQDAITELSIYVSNYCIKHGNFRYYPYRTPLVDSKVILPKKPHRRGRHRRSPSDKQLNDSLFYDFQTNLKTALQNSSADSNFSPNNCEMECAETSSERSNASEPVAVCMTFTTDDETGSYNQMSMTSKLINASTVESSVPEEYSTPVTGCDPIIVETPDFLHNTHDLVQSKLNSCDGTTLQNGSVHFMNSESSNLFPVITSVTAEASLNPAFVPEEPVCFSNESLKPEAAKILSNLLLNSENMPNCENSYAHNLLNQQGNSVIIEDDDDIMVLKQDSPKQSEVVNAILRSPGLTHALTQIIISNKPHLQEAYHKVLTMGLKAFLEIWLALNLNKQEENEFYVFLKSYNKVIKANEDLKVENLSLREQNLSLKEEKISLSIEKESLKQEKESLKKGYDLLKFRNENLQVELNTKLNMIKIRKANADRIAAFLSTNTDKLRNETQEFELLQAQNLKEIRTLKERLFEVGNNLLEKKSELEKHKEHILQLEEQLKCLSKKAKRTNSKCQTDLSDLPCNNMYTLKELKNYKRCYQGHKSSSRCKNTKAFKMRTSSFIQIEEDEEQKVGAYNPNKTQIFETGTFAMPQKHF